MALGLGLSLDSVAPGQRFEHGKIECCGIAIVAVGDPAGDGQDHLALRPAELAGV
jgi:hypothetical protein